MVDDTSVQEEEEQGEEGKSDVGYSMSVIVGNSGP